MIAADVMVIPSMQENLPNTIMEPMACGTPVVVSDTGGLREIVVDGTGLTFPPRDAEQLADRIAENCEPSLCSVLFMGGAGGSLRAGVTENPVRLTRSVKESLTHVSCGGAEAYVWPGGGITVMVDVMDMPTNSFGYVPTPALVAPIEFTLRREDYGTLGGHMEHIQPVRDVVTDDVRRVAQQLLQPDPNARENYGWSKDET